MEWPEIKLLADYGVPWFDAIVASSKTQGLPLGAIVAVCEMADCVGILGGGKYGVLLDGTIVDPPEFHFGDYSPNRYAWKLANVRKLERPIPFRGRQQLFEVPDELLASVLATA